MIRIVGTSHVSQESIKRIDESFEENQPDVICLELDAGRLNSLMTDNPAKPQNMLHRVLSSLQKYIGSKTGMMPGQEMLYAYEKAKKQDMEIYLIDRDINITLGRINNVRRKEKVKALFLMPFSLLGTKFDYKSIPDEEALEELTNHFKEQFPGLYQVLVEERDNYMAEALKTVQEEHEDESIVAVVGAAHKKGLEERIKQ